MGKTLVAELKFSIFQLLSIGVFGLFFGLFETTTNIFYLLTNNKKWPRLQHGKELPLQVEERIVKRKVVQMLVLGTLLLSITFISIIISPQLFVVGSVLIFANGILDYGKYRKKNFLLIWIMISLISFLLLLV